MTDWHSARQEILARDQFSCSYCLDDADQVDHIIPRCQGGTDELSNLTTACGRCNQSKGGLTPYEWSLRDKFILPPWWYKETRP